MMTITALNTKIKSRDLTQEFVTRIILSPNLFVPSLKNSWMPLLMHQ